MAGRRGHLDRWADIVDTEGGDPSERTDQPGWSSKASWEADIEHWSSMWSDELVTAWHILREHCASAGLPFLEKGSYSDFVEFVFKYSSQALPLV